MKDSHGFHILTELFGDELTAELCRRGADRRQIYNALGEIHIIQLRGVVIKRKARASAVAGLFRHLPGRLPGSTTSRLPD